MRRDESADRTAAAPGLCCVLRLRLRLLQL
jgi:hypothetical protein